MSRYTHYWVCPKGEFFKTGRTKGSIPDTFEDMKRLFWLYSTDDAKAEVWRLSDNKNVTDKFLAVSEKYNKLKNEMTKLVEESFELSIT